MTDIFISYSHKDEIWKERLQAPLRALQLHNDFEVWDDRQIELGANWLPAIENAIAHAKVAVLIISNDFLVSDFVLREEIPKFLQRREQEGLRVVPLIVRPCPWEGVPWLAELQGATKDNKPLVYLDTEHEIEDALSRVALAIHRLLKDAQAEEAQAKARAEQAEREAQAQQDAAEKAEQERKEREQAEAERLRKQEEKRRRQAQGGGGKSGLWGLGAVAVAGAVWWFWPAPEPKPVALFTPERVVASNDAAASRQPIEPEMVRIPAGSFEMGCKEGWDDVEGGCDNDEKPLRIVNVPAFEISRTEITRGQFKAFIEATDYKTTADKEGSCWGDKDGKGAWGYVEGNNWQKPGFEQTDTHPVVCVSWDDAQAYIAWLNQETGRNYRLLTEAEWEYAARGGKQDSAYPWGQDGSGEIACRSANLADEVLKKRYPDWSWSIANCPDGYVYTAPVQSFALNGYELADMHGNVWEWVQDCYKNSYDDAPKSGAAVESSSCESRVLRGGSWLNTPWNLRSALRDWVNPTARFPYVGFRLARTF